jgi:hypothetical protein
LLERLNQDQDENYYIKKLEIENFKKVSISCPNQVISFICGSFGTICQYWWLDDMNVHQAHPREMTEIPQHRTMKYLNPKYWFQYKIVIIVELWLETIIGHKLKTGKLN